MQTELFSSLSFCLFGKDSHTLNLPDSDSYWNNLFLAKGSIYSLQLEVIDTIAHIVAEFRNWRGASVVDASRILRAVNSVT